MKLFKCPFDAVSNLDEYEKIAEGIETNSEVPSDKPRKFLQDTRKVKRKQF